MTHQQNLIDGMDAHRAGRLDEAEQIYLKVIDSLPQNAPELAQTWHFVAALRHQTGNIIVARQNALKALALNPNFPEALNTLGMIEKDLGQLSEAEQSFRKAIELHDEFPQALTNLADVRRRQGDIKEARALNDKALVLAPDLAPAHNNLGATQLDEGDLKSAASAFERALVFDTTLNDARINLADTRRRLGDFEKAQSLAEEALRQENNNPFARNILGLIYYDHGIYREALDCFNRALKEAPDLVDALNNKGNVLVRLNNLPEALECFDAVLIQNPDFIDALANQAAAYQAMGRIDDALSACQKALSSQPDHADARWNRGLARLISGDYSGGFSDYEGRWRLAEFSARHCHLPLWQGEDLSGKSLLVHSEQGFGDTIQMARYLTLLVEKGARLIIETHSPLVKLLSDLDIADQIIVQGDDIPPSDYQIPIMSLPDRFRTTLDTVPNPAAFKPGTRFEFESDAKITIGLVWAGRPTHKNDQNRSVPLALFKGIAEMEETNLISLQVGARAEDLTQLPWRDQIADISSHLTDFSATARIIQKLDLVISVDTAVAHLAGSMGKDCWVLLPYAPDWRWMLNRNDSPWYESVRLFRQIEPPHSDNSENMWRGVIKNIESALIDRLSLE